MKKNIIASLVLAVSFAGCGGAEDVVQPAKDNGQPTIIINNYITAPDGGVGTTVNNNTTNTTTINNYYAASMDGGTAPAIDGGSVVVTDAQPQIVPTPSVPAKEDIALLELKGGERMFDGSNGKFAWVQADGALLAFDSFTGIVRQINKPTAGSVDSLKFYDAVLALAVNTDGKVAWVYQNNDTRDISSIIVMYEDMQINSRSFSRAGVQSTLSASIAVGQFMIGYIVPQDEYNNFYIGWYDLFTGNTAIKPQTAVADYSGTPAISNLRLHGNTFGFMVRSQFVEFDLDNAANNATIGLVYVLRTDFNSRNMLALGGYMGSYWLYLANMDGTQSVSLDSGYISDLTCTRCIALSASGDIAVWSVNGGLRYQQLNVAGSTPQYIPSVNEFVLGDTRLYYIGTDSAGKFRLYSHDL